MSTSVSQFSVLFVCTGNICRSPLAELLLRQYFNTPEIVTYSAGTGALVGQPMPEIQQNLAKELDIAAPEDHQGQQLTVEHIERADLILTMERAHRSTVVQQVPRALRRTFTLPELARVSSVVSDEELQFDSPNLAERLNVLVEAAATNRGLAVPPEDPNDDDIVDPYRRGEQTYLESRDQVVTALNTVAHYLNRVGQ